MLRDGMDLPPLYYSQSPGIASLSFSVFIVYLGSESEKRFVVSRNRRRGRSVGDVSGVEREDGERAETELRRGDAGEFSLDCEDDGEGRQRNRAQKSGNSVGDSISLAGKIRNQ
ncbi:hypothetical protein Bca52824_050001 [Brassica carinata]|uniref:Uncharacterized protein n=1 Tax=Brassica carinata TaxID=52824 RepID=A0A8X7RLZ0_BRACI|nr:hypothetical protein Bca52824_050001 [Brassica carinata]